MSPPTPDTPRRTRRWMWLPALLLLLAAGHVAGFHWLLNAAWPQAWLSDRIGLSIEWEAGHSLWPGRLSLTSLRLASDDPAQPLEIDVARADLEISLPALLAGRLELTRGTAEGLRALRLGHYRLEGDGSLAVAGLRLAPDRIEADTLALSLAEASIHRGPTVLANEIALDTDLRLEAFHPRQPVDLDAARHLSGHLSLAATADAWDVFAPYLRQLEWLDLAGHGELAGELTLERGVLAPGSELVLDSPSLQVELDESLLLTPREADAPPPDARQWKVVGEAPERHRLIGAGRITSRIEAGDEGPEARLEVTLHEMVMQRAGLADPFMTSETFRLAATLPGADLADAPRRLTEASLEWDAARLPNVGALSPYLPEGGPLSLLSGGAALDGRLDYRDGVLAGAFQLTGSAVDLRLLGQRLSGDMTLDLNLAELDPGARRLDLGGSRLRLSASGERDEAPLTTELTLEEARLTSALPLSLLVNPSAPPPLSGRVALRGRVGQLDVLDGFLDRVMGDNEILLEGDGELAASLDLEQGRIAAGSRVAVTTDSLGIAVLGLEARGRGSLAASWQPALGRARGRLDARVEEARVDRVRDGRRMMQGGELSLVAESELLDLSPTLSLPTLRVEWQGAEMPDVEVLQAYLPSGVPFRLDSGRAETHGELSVEAGRVRGRIELAGQRIAGELLNEAFAGELSLALRVGEASLDGSSLDLSGSRLEIQAGEASVAAEDRLRTLLVARRAVLGPLPLPDQPAVSQPMSGELSLEGLITNLGVLDDFLPAAHGLTLAGGGRFVADLALDQGRLLPDSRLEVAADELAVGFLDYEASGRGELRLDLERAADEGPDPSARLRLSLPTFDLRQLGDARPHIHGRHFQLETRLPRLRLDAPSASLHGVTTRIQLPIANVDDLARYNDYLPADAGLELLSGRAGLEADLTLEGLEVRGDLTLQAFDAGLRLADQRLAGDLRLDARLRDGDLAGRHFDAAGSVLRLDNISREDASGQRDAGWWARLVLEEGKLTWTQPLVLEARLGLSLRDSGLLARLFLARARERDWLGRLLTVRQVQGSARLTMDDRGVSMRDIRLEGGNLTLLANLLMRDDDLSGDFYARLGALGVGLALEDGETRLRLWQPKRWFDQGTVGEGDEEAMVEADPDAWRERAQQQGTP
ncbi:hypothetical protein [Halomonas campaniensis]|uniref:hypothetical protein n=1 Tax=Halomonas campaniensis TaxID=213554 RepID=UPI00397053ED